MADVPEMVERVASVLVYYIQNNTQAYDAAHAAIAAMRQPTEAMSKAGDRASGADGAHDCEVPMTDVWRAMIDAALASDAGRSGDSGGGAPDVGREVR